MTTALKPPENKFIAELRDFVAFLKNLWALLGALAAAFPLGNMFAQIVPLKNASAQGGFMILEPEQVAGFASLLSLFTVFSLFLRRRELAKPARDKRFQKAAWKTFWIGVACLVAYFMAYYAKDCSCLGMDSDDLRHIYLDIPVAALYAATFTLITRAFMMLSLVAWVSGRPAEEAR